MNNTLLECRDITVRFGRGYEAFDAVSDASVKVVENEAIGIVGESGSGKTTLARVMVGLQTPDQGDVLLENKVLDSGEHTEGISQSDRWKVQMVSANLERDLDRFDAARKRLNKFPRESLKPESELNMAFDQLEKLIGERDSSPHNLRGD